MSIVKLLIVTCFCFISNISISGGQEEIDFKVIESSLLGNYLELVSNNMQGGEASMRFSEKFAHQFPSSCKLTVQLQAFSLKPGQPSWHRGGGVSFVDLSPDSLLKQRFYIGGVGQSLIVNIIYFSENCDGIEESLRFNLQL